MEKKGKNNFNLELNALFEKLLEQREKGLKGMEEMKERMMSRLDQEISRLYAKRDFIAEMWGRREELKLKRISVIGNIMSNSAAMNMRYLVSMPFIYAILVPAFLMHILVELYHQVCFRLYGIPLVKPSDYFIFDRRLLPYLNWLERFNCLYCSYFNCLVAYMREIGARTERFWCPIKHSKAIKDPHRHYDEFVDYSDAKSLRREWEKLKDFQKK